MWVPLILSLSPQTTPFTTSTPSPTTRAPPWGDTTLPTARAPSPASGTASTIPGEAVQVARGGGPHVGTPWLMVHLPLSLQRHPHVLQPRAQQRCLPALLRAGQPILTHVAGPWAPLGASYLDLGPPRTAESPETRAGPRQPQCLRAAGVCFLPWGRFFFFSFWCVIKILSKGRGAACSHRDLGDTRSWVSSGISVPLCHPRGSVSLLPAPPNLLVKDRSSSVASIPPPSSFRSAPDSRPGGRMMLHGVSFYLSRTSLSPDHPSWLPRDSGRGGLTHLLIRRCLKPFRGAGGPWGAQGCPSYGGVGGWAAPF